MILFLFGVMRAVLNILVIIHALYKNGTMSGLSSNETPEMW